jgi:hypothetical protein
VIKTRRAAGARCRTSIGAFAFVANAAFPRLAVAFKATSANVIEVLCAKRAICTVSASAFAIVSKTVFSYQPDRAITGVAAFATGQKAR